MPLGQWLLFGLVIGPLTAVLTTLIFAGLVRLGMWDPDRDEASDAIPSEESDVEEPVEAEPTAAERRLPPLGISLLPILVPLLLIAAGAFAQLFGFSDRAAAATEANGTLLRSAASTLNLVSEPEIALFIGLVGAFLMARRVLREHRTSEALKNGFHTTGEILLITGVGGSLGAVISATGLDQTLAGFFTANPDAPVALLILLAWAAVAVLHVAIGSVSVAAIAAAGIIAPVLGQVDVSPLAIGLAIASGALFALHVNSNFFWMFKSLLGLTTRGTIRSLTVVTSISSFVSLPMALVVALVL